MPFLRPSNWLKRPWSPLILPTTNFDRLPATCKIDEENLPGYVASEFYPTRLGQILRDRYQVVGKLGYGATSTAWLARDMPYRRYVTLKISIAAASLGNQWSHEIEMYSRIEQGSKSHPGKSDVRTLLDSFEIDGPDDKHQCLVHTPLWGSIWDFLHHTSTDTLSSQLLALTLHRLFLALDYLHSECRLIHTDIKADNIMFSMNNASILEDFEQGELSEPCPRKEEDGRIIYTSRELKTPQRVGLPQLCDLGSAVTSDVEHTEYIQPDAYRSPEVILEIPWTSRVDIWNVGCMIWDVFEGDRLFTGKDPEVAKYRSRAHLAEIIDLLGPAPQHLVNRGQRSGEFFSNGEFKTPQLLKRHTPLEERETILEGEDREVFLRMMRKMLHWEPEKRGSALELAEDEWIVSQFE